MERNNELAEVLYTTFFDGITGGTYVECTVHNNPLCVHMHSKYGWSGYNLNPLLENFNKIDESRPNDVNINAMFSFRNGFWDLKLENGDKLEVNTFTYDGFVINHNIPQIDLLVLNADGLEYSVIERFFLTKRKPKVLCMCLNHPHMVKITEELLGMGYEESELDLPDNKIYAL